MPCSDNIEALEEYSSILQEISSICIKSSTQFLVLGGDWNADPSRKDGRTKLFKEFIANENLMNVLDLDIANVPYTYESSRQIGVPPSISKIDHFLISPNLINSVSCYESIFLHNNFSDHIPLMLKLNIDVKFHETYEREFKPSVAWHKCNNRSIDTYKCKLDQLLLKINPQHDALKCRNYKCTLHKNYIQTLYKELIECCCDASKKCLPHTSLKNDNKRSKTIPGWNEYVKEHAEKAKIWHDVWIECGKPRQGDVANERRKTKLKYHYAIRYVKKENIRLRNVRMGEAISENNDRLLWTEVKKMSSTNNKLPTVMDGQNGIEEISKIFSTKYESLYKSVGFCTQEMNRLSNDIESHIDNGCPSEGMLSNHSHTITVNEVKEAVNSLKSDKKEENGLYSNHFKFGSDRLFVIIALLFNCMLIHGIAPDDLLLGTMIPLIKDSRGNKQCSDNYRSLTIGTGLSKLLDIIIQKQQSAALSASDLQFGFKANSSTSMCTFMVLETIEYYKSRGGNVHVLLLDASKAFDRVNYIKLFDKLLSKGMCPLTVRLLLSMYTNQKLQVKWNSRLSSKFDVTNGVRQGGVLSPLLFSLYVDDLLVKLKENGIGCNIGQHFVGAFGYADDLILLSPTVYGMEIMIKICEDYADEHSIIFNGKKSMYLVFGKYRYNPILKVNNEIVPRCESAMHLGHLLHTENTNMALVEYAMNSFNASYHGFMSRFGSCNNITKSKLLHQYCSAMYGSQLWDLTSKSVDKICTQWRKAHRCVLSVPYNTHCDLLPLIAQSRPMDLILDCKYMNFIKSIITSNNIIVKYMAVNRLNDNTSIVRRNMTHLIYKYDLVMDDVLTYSKDKMKKHCYAKWLAGIDIEYPRYAQIVRDMTTVKEYRNRTEEEFSDDECNFVINFVCTI